ncbi:Dynactin subunit 2 isoform 1 [Schistosoma japonicum]|nr:Dynactin subunit 2 isoform 1 [Schistosoma japonicum]
MAEIDRRIHRIEALIGQPDPNKLTVLTADTTTHGLLEACSRLSARSSLFQQGHLDMIEARLAALQGKLQAVTEKREAIADYDMQSKIAELYELVKKWNDVADSLPMIVERLSTLKSLHEEASQFSQSLCAIESSQKNVEGSLSSYAKLLEEVQNNVVKNMEVIKDNFATIESHFAISTK